MIIIACLFILAILILGFTEMKPLGPDDSIIRKGKIVAVLKTPEGSRVLKTKNIITTTGDVFYAQKGAGETPTNNFASLFLGSKATPTTGKASTLASMTLITGTEKALAAGYPKTNDSDADNGSGGANVVTYKYTYTKADFAAASITEGCIAAAGAIGTAPVLCHFAFESPFEKTANDTLTVFVNHTGTGS